MDTQQILAFDIIVAGGGASGMAFALAVAQRSNLRIALVEANKNAAELTKPKLQLLDVRSVAMSAFSCEFLHRVGIDDLAQLAQPIEHIYVSDAGHIGQTSLHSKDFGRPYLGQVIELDVLNTALLKQIERLPQGQVQWFCPNTISQIDKHADYIEVCLQSQQRLRAPLLVIADGGQSATRELAGIEVKRSDYGQSAVVANVQFDRDHQNKAYERFTPHGPLALLPMRTAQDSAPQCSLVWTIESQMHEHFTQMDDLTFIAALQDAFGYRLGRMTKVGERQVFPLSLQVAQQHIQHRIAVIGNAAQSLHPIAGQGLNLGIRDIAQLTNLVLSDKDPGCYKVLGQYQSSRQSDQKQTVVATDSLVTLFSNTHVPLMVGRNLGLLGMQSCHSLKQRFAMHAMGYKQTRQIDAKL